MIENAVLLLTDLFERPLNGCQALYQFFHTGVSLGAGDALSSKREQALVNALNNGREFCEDVIQTSMISKVEYGRIAANDVTYRQ